MKIADTDNNFTPFRLLLAVLVVFGHFQAFVGVNSPPWPYNYAATASTASLSSAAIWSPPASIAIPTCFAFTSGDSSASYPLYLAVIILQALALAGMAPGGPWPMSARRSAICSSMRSSRISYSTISAA